jgi:hypothetical protein
MRARLHANNTSHDVEVYVDYRNEEITAVYVLENEELKDVDVLDLLHGDQVHDLWEQIFLR